MRRNRCHDMGRGSGEPTTCYNFATCQQGWEICGALVDVATHIPTCIEVPCVIQPFGTFEQVRPRGNQKIAHCSTLWVRTSRALVHGDPSFPEKRSMVFETSFFRDNVKSPKPELDKCPCRWRDEHCDHVERGDDWNEAVETIEHASDSVAGKKCEERLWKRCRNAQQMSKIEASRTHACAHKNVISVEHVLRCTHDRGKSLDRKKRKTSRKNRSAGRRQLVANKTSNACTFDSSRLAENHFSCRRETIRFFQDQLIGPCDAQMSMCGETLGMWTSPTQKKKTKLHTIGPVTATKRTNTTL